MGSLGLLVSFILVSLFAQCLGQGKVCKKPLKGKLGNIVVVAKPPCVLSDVTAKIITVKVNGNLTVKGISKIEGINARDGAIISLKNRTSVGIVTASGSASINLFAEETSFVESLVLSEAGSTLAQGPFGSIESENSGFLNVAFSSVRDDIRVQGGKGGIKICGSTIMKRTFITSRRGQLTLGNFAKDCPGSVFKQKLRIARGRGSITFQSSVAKKISIANRVGDVSLSFSSLGTTSISGISGDVNITSSSTNKETTLQNIDGAITLSGTGFSGKVVVTEKKRREVGTTTIKESSFQKSAGKVRLQVERRRKLVIENTNFFNGTGVLLRNGGPVVFSGNADVSVSFRRDKRVQVFNNKIINLGLTSCTGGALIETNVLGNAEVDSCSGKITISRNSVRRLRCTENTPAPVGKDNSISKLATGQCRKFLR